MDPTRDNFEPSDDDAAEIVWLFDPDDEPDPPTCTPAELFGNLQRAVDRETHRLVVVRGVVRGVRRRGRICTFELADHHAGADTPAAVIRVELFPDDLSVVEAELADSGHRLVDGIDATVSGPVRFDPALGAVRIAATVVEAHDTQPDIAARTTALVADLEASGLLGRQATHVVPGRPVRVGLITATGTAGDVDVTALLEASGLGWQFLRCSVPMSGPNAPAAVAAAIGDLSGAGPDVIVVAWGGGAGSDLVCWDSDLVARAIAAAPVPVWRAIGHASDASVADRVANRSRVTPSAAAAALIERVRDFERHRHQRTVVGDHRDRMATDRAQTLNARIAGGVAVAFLVLVVLLALR